MKIVEDNPVVYRCVSFRFLDEDNNNKETDGNFLFSEKIYHDSLHALNEVLNKPCNCENPEESHKWCKVDLTTEYSTFDTWYKFSSEHIMANPQRIKELATELDCPYKMLYDEKIMTEIIDWIDTDEGLEWSEPPERRKHFLKIDKIEYKEEFDPESDYQTLFNIFCDWIKTESDERKKISLLHVACSTKNGYRFWCQ